MLSFISQNLPAFSPGINVDALQLEGLKFEPPTELFHRLAKWYRLKTNIILLLPLSCGRGRG